MDDAGAQEPPLTDAEAADCNRARTGLLTATGTARHYRDGRVLRTLSQRAYGNWQRLQATAFFARHVGSIVATTDCGPLPDGGGLSSTRASPSSPTPTNGPSGCSRMRRCCIWS